VSTHCGISASEPSSIGLTRRIIFTQNFSPESSYAEYVNGNNTSELDEGANLLGVIEIPHFEDIIMNPPDTLVQCASMKDSAVSQIKPILCASPQHNH